MGTTDAAFAGSIPANYERYLGLLLFQPYAENMAARLLDIARGRVLETAAGTGIVTRALARALSPQVEILATDLNQGMLDMAASKLQAPNVRWQQADAQALPFENAAFDAVVCQFGVMFFPDRPAGYREALRVLKPGGRFLFSVWGRLEDNPLSHALSEAAAKLFPDDPPRFLERTPFGYFDQDRIRTELQQAGFGHIEIEPVGMVTQCPSARDAAMGFCHGTPLRGEIETRAPGRLDEMTGRIAENFTARFGTGPIGNPMQALVVTASA